MSNTRAHFPNFNGPDGQALADHLRNAAASIDNTQDPFAAFHRIRDEALPLLPEQAQPKAEDNEGPRIGMTLYVDASEYASHKNNITAILQNNVSNNLGSKQDDKVIIAQIAEAEKTEQGIVVIDMIIGTDDPSKLSDAVRVITDRLDPKLREIGLKELYIDQTDLNTVKMKLEGQKTEYRSPTSSGLYLFT